MKRPLLWREVFGAAAWILATLVWIIGCVYGFEGHYGHACFDMLLALGLIHGERAS